MPDRIPALMTVECTLLVNHDGCFKCRYFYTTHKLPDCPDGFPAKATYIPLTELDALIAKRHQEEKSKPAVTTAMVPTPAAVIMPSAILGDRSDSELVLPRS
jgi:hypothetical protein